MPITRWSRWATTFIASPKASANVGRALGEISSLPFSTSNAPQPWNVRASRSAGS